MDHQSPNCAHILRWFSTNIHLQHKLKGTRGFDTAVRVGESWGRGGGVGREKDMGVAGH